MQSNSTPFSPIPFLFNGDLSSEGGGFEGTRVLLFASLLFSQGVGAGVGGGSGSGIGMDLSKVGEKILSSVRSARSLGLLPSTPDRPQVPARAVAAAAVARALAGIPPHKRQSLASSSAELSSIYGSTPHGEAVEELEEDFYEEEFDPVGFVLEHIPSEDSDAEYFEEKAAVRLAQLDRITERLSHHVMEHHEEMVKGMQLVRELEKDLKVANVICMNGRRHLTSSMNEVSRDLVVPTRSKKKQFLLDMLPILAELRHARDMQVTLESHVDEGNFFKAFQVLSEYLQILDSLSELSAIKEMSRGVEVWLGKTLQKLDSLLLGVCQDFKEDGYITVIDAYAIIGDVSGLAEKIQSFFMQEVLSETHSVLRNVLQEDLENSNPQTSRLTYSDLCHHIPESKFRQCLLTTLSVLFNLMSSYYAIMSFRPEDKISACLTPDVRQKQVDSSNSCSSSPNVDDFPSSECLDRGHTSSSANSATDTSDSTCLESNELVDQCRDGGREASSSGSPWFQLRKDATDFVSQTLHRGCKNLWQLTASRLSVLLSSSAVCSSSIHQFLKNYEDLNIFIVAGEAFCGAEAVEFRQKLKAVCENYFVAFHKQNIHALKMVLEKEIWLKLPPETIQSVSFAGLLGDGAPLFVPSDRNSLNSKGLHANKSADSVKVGVKKSEFSDWVGSGNPFTMKLNLKECSDSVAVNVIESGEPDGKIVDSPSNKLSQNNDSNHVNGNSPLSEDENEDLHADFIDEDSQLPSRIYKPKRRKNSLSHFNDEEMTAQTGSSLCLLRLMDKYARLMQKLEIVNIDFFKGISQLFGIFFHFVFETFGDQNTHSSGKGSADALSYRLKTALSRISQDCDQWIKPQSISFSSSPTSTNAPLSHMDVTPTSPHSAGFIYPPGTSFGLKERCAAADTISLVARVLHRSKAHLQSALVQNNAAVVEDFYSNLVESVTDLTLHIHRTTARILLHVNGYVDRIANAKWEVKDLGLEHNGYVDLLLGEFKHYKTRLSHGGLQKEVQDFLLDYGVDIVAETLVEGISRVRKCSDEGRVLMSLDLQVLINGLQHFVPAKVKPKLQIVETFIKAYYLPETEFVHWARTHPERCAAADTISLVARVLHRSKAHLQSALVQNNAAVVEDFYSNLVESVTDLTLHIHRTTARILLHVNGYVDRIANAKWEVKDLGLEHNGYVDLLLGEFKHYKTRLSHGGLQKEVQDFLLDYGVDIVAETLVEGISRVRKCSDEGRVLMSLDLQVLINGLQHFVPAKVKPKLQIVETFIKAYYLPETEFVHWARTHPVQDFLLDYGVDIVAETLVEGISRVRKCSDEGRVLMSLDLQVLINGLQHFVPAKVKPKLQIVETFIKAYYLPETEFVHWARTHPEYSKSQIIGLITLVATVKGWKRKTRLEVLEKIEGA